MSTSVIREILHGTAEGVASALAETTCLEVQEAVPVDIDGEECELRLTPLMAVAFARAQGRIEKATLLLRAGADTRVQVGKDTALLCASTGIGKSSWRPDMELVRLLLRHGARLPIHEAIGCPLAWVISGGGQLELLQLLVEAGERVTPPPRPCDMERFCEAEKQWKELRKQIRAGSAEVQASFHLFRPVRDEWIDALKRRYWPPGQNPLHVAVRADRLEVVRWLLERGADPRALDSWGQTPMHEVRSIEVLRAILAAGASAEGEDLQWRTPLEAAAERPELSPALLEELLKAEQVAGAPTGDVDCVAIAVLRRVGRVISVAEGRQFLWLLARYGREWGRQPSLNDDTLHELVRHADPTAVALACDCGILSRLRGRVQGVCCGEADHGGPLLHVFGSPRAREMVDVLRAYGARVLHRNSRGETVAESALLRLSAAYGDHERRLAVIRDFVKTVEEDSKWNGADAGVQSLERHCEKWLREVFPAVLLATESPESEEALLRIASYLLAIEIKERVGS